MLKKMKSVPAFNFSDVVFIMLMNVLKNANKIQLISCYIDIKITIVFCGKNKGSFCKGKNY